MSEITEDVGTTKPIIMPRPNVTLSHGLDGGVEYPGTPPITLESEEPAPCVTA